MGPPLFGAMASHAIDMHAREIVNRILFRLRGRVVHLKPKGAVRGRVLISYTTLPFLGAGEHLFNTHTNTWECFHMAEAFRARGYAVDVIDTHNMRFIPRKQYRYALDVHANLDRLAPLLNPDCIKIYHICTQHWRANNASEQKRLDAFKARRGITQRPERMMPENTAAEKADLLLLLGNDATAATYAHIDHPVFRIPISTTFTFGSPNNKDFRAARRSFVWQGGAGAIHKGVDLLIEAFAEMPEFELHLLGKYADPVLLSAYERELKLSNIISHGVVKLGSAAYKEITSRSLAVLSPSCAEGQSGSVIVGMHAGLIPIVSRESGIDTHDFGVTLRGDSVEEIRKEVRRVSALPAAELQRMALGTWQYARAHHTREKFTEAFGTFLDRLESGYYRLHA